MTATLAREPGIRLPLLEPGTDGWLRSMSASKIAAVVGLSPYESRFRLWHRMADLLPVEPMAPHLARGHYLEDGICRWFADQHPDWTIADGGTWQHPTEPRFTASPDRVLLVDGERRGLEVKTAANDDEWGEPGTDQVPAGYAAQVQWQMHCGGYDITHVAVLSAFLELREYVITYNPTDAAWLHTEALTFLNSLPDGPTPQRPDIDAHDATYEAIRQLHPGIDPTRTVEVEFELYLRYAAAIENAKTATSELQQCKALLLDLMGDARNAQCNDIPVARRQPARGDAVALYSAIPKDRS